MAIVTTLQPLRCCRWCREMASTLAMVILLLLGFLVEPNCSFVQPFPQHSAVSTTFHNVRNIKPISSRSSKPLFASPASNSTFPVATESSTALDVAGDVDTSSKQDDGRSDGIVESIVDYFTATNDEDDDHDEIGTSRGRKRGNVQLVAGSGKTYIAWKVMEKILLLDGDGHDDDTSSSSRKPEQKIGVYVTPYLNLVDQALKNKDEHEIMMTDSNNMMIVASRTSRKTEKCTTDVDDITEFIISRSNEDDRNNINENEPKILVCTYNSLPKIGEAIERLRLEEEESMNGKKSSIGIDFAIFDEAHKMEGLVTIEKKETNDDENRSKHGFGFAYGLYDFNIDIKHRLFMTGTPHNYTQTAKVLTTLGTRFTPDGGRVMVTKRENKNDEKTSSAAAAAAVKPKIRSFSDESLFGPCLARKTHQESVEQNVTLPISLFGVETRLFREHDGDGDGDGDFDVGSGTGSSKDYYLPLAIQSAFYKLNIKHAVSFHSTNQRARDFMMMAREVFASGDNNNNDDDRISLFNVDHKMSPSKREETLRDAENSPKSLITNCKLLSMGVDEASWDLVMIADPVRSMVDGLQMIGRVGRKAPGKEKGYVLVPVPILDEDGDFIADDHTYKIFVNTFNHMVSLNPELRQDVLFVIEKSSEFGRPLLDTEYPERVKDAFILPTMPLELKNQLMDRAIVEYKKDFTYRWDSIFALLIVFKQREGHCNVPIEHQENGENLGTWLRGQRASKKTGTIDSIREKKLEELGIVWEPLSRRWEEMVALLSRYKQREGDCNVPANYEEEGVSLGRWLANHRIRKREGALNAAKVEQLEQVGVVWSVFSQRWEDMYSRLAQYKQREGHSNVPRMYVEDGETLGQWLYTQRRLKFTGKIDSLKEEKLEEINVVWDDQSRRWEGMYALLEQYKLREGDCNISNKHKENGKNLGVWLSKQRQLKKNGNLDVTNEKRLEELGVVWNIFTHQWEATYKLLEQYKQREGHCNVPIKEKEDGENLGQWLNTQRTSKKSRSLDVMKEKRLEELGVVWDQFFQQWEDMYALLSKYSRREGHCKVPLGYKEDEKNLGNWLNTQRQYKRSGTIDNSRIRRLEDIGMIWNFS